MPTSRIIQWAKVGIVLTVLIALALAYRFDVFSNVSDPKSFARAVVELGGWGYAGFIVAYALLQPFGVPGTVFIVAAPLIWPWPIAFALSMAGTMAASIIGFSFARFIARDWVAARIPQRLRKYDEALERNAFQTVFTLRLILWMPQVLHGFLGISKVPFWTHVWGSFLGYIPPLFVVSYFTAEVFDGSGRMKSDAWMIMGGLLAFSLTLIFIMRRFRKSKSVD